MGNYDTTTGQTLMIVFETCDEKKLPQGIEKCASKEEINEWMNTRYLVTLENEKRFIEHKFNQDRVVASAETKWFPLNSQSRSDYVRLITRTRMDLEDDYWGF